MLEEERVNIKRVTSLNSLDNKSSITRITYHESVVFHHIAFDDFAIVFEQRLNILDGSFFRNLSDEYFERIT